MTISFFTPAYIDIVHKSGDRWIRLKTLTICNMSGKSYDSSQKFAKFDLTPMKILVELYKRYQGLDGWYLIHMAEKNYYYCGATAKDVQSKLYELGINQRG
jgi:hypothetical protein